MVVNIFMHLLGSIPIHYTMLLVRWIAKLYTIA
jgi:hypothetical protein